MDTTKTPAPNAVDLDKADTEAPAEAAGLELEDAEPEAEELAAEQAEDDEQPSHAGAAASAIVAAGLSVVALSGSWVAGIVSERSSIAARLELSQAADANAQIAAQFVGPWHSTALVNGIFSTLALIIAVFVLALPAFASPERHLPTWVRSVSWASIALGALGILLFVLMYFDLLLAVPKAAG
ncbi:hypothetical protein [Streptomyces sp. ISL-94]|uniref:hypothetical protein n=1 Tax=Streptomyces sp. ISL-94 TaxID=2819190 RepID=UPI001BEC9642|nr:hypothetical protein [Streptomyces sp. ISL-94]MBT2477289.1 hypothetical protein [Streptomyces sp. ISL-94]